MELARKEQVIDRLEREIRSLRRAQENTSLTKVKPVVTDGYSAQTRIIEKLQQELVKTQGDLAKQKERYEKKIKRLRTESAKVRTETAMTIFELKQENAKFVEEKNSSETWSRQSSASTSRTQPTCANCGKSLSAGSAGKRSCATSSTADEGVGDVQGSNLHTGLILELSAQVAALDDELAKARLTIAAYEKNAALAGLH
eukprot:Colp12_sorted_trinity150504_noHs@25854